MARPLVGMILWGFGKIVYESEDKKSLGIIQTERKDFKSHAEYWDSRFVKRFSTLEEAAKTYQENHNNHHDIRDRDITDEDIKFRMKYSFPGYFTKK